METVSIILNAILAPAFIVAILTLRSIVRKKKAEAGLSETDLRRAEIEIDKIEDAADREHMNNIISELRAVRQLLHEANERLTKKELEVISWTHRALVAEKARCECWDCTKRIPPIIKSYEKDYFKSDNVPEIG